MEDGIRGGRGRLKRDATGMERVGGTFFVNWGGILSDKKINEKNTAAMAWPSYNGDTQQPANSRQQQWMEVGVTSSWAKRLGWGVVVLFGPSK